MPTSPISESISLRLKYALEETKARFQSSGNIRYCVIDDLLPVHIASELSTAFDSNTDLNYKSSLREQKRSTNQLSSIATELKQAVLAFESNDILEMVKKITGFDSLVKDEHMYAGGVSEMSLGHFVLPHIDNSHDFLRDNYRAVNVLYYLSGEESVEGGCLELWPDGLRGEPLIIEPKHNRLVIMETPPHAWHAVTPVVSDALRRCIFYTYFQPEPLADTPYFQVTSMRARPGNAILDAILMIDIKLRMFIRHLFPRGIRGDRVIWKR